MLIACVGDMPIGKVRGGSVLIGPFNGEFAQYRLAD
jgi:hypothetical protein